MKGRLYVSFYSILYEGLDVGIPGGSWNKSSENTEGELCLALNFEIYSGKMIADFHQHLQPLTQSTGVRIFLT